MLKVLEQDSTVLNHASVELENDPEIQFIAKNSVKKKSFRSVGDRTFG